MFFRRRKAEQDEIVDATGVTDSRRPSAASTAAETAHLIGPGCLKVEGSLLRWEPIAGRHVILYPKRIGRILLYGATDATGTALRLAWRFGIHIVFLTPQGHQILGRVQPAGNAPHLTWLQHQCVLDSGFRLTFCQRLVHTKIEAAVTQTRYYQQQGKTQDGGSTIRALKNLQASCKRGASLESIRGLEGTAARLWFEVLGKLLPDGWIFPGRQARPVKDPVNALLSLGYSLLVTRCQVLLAASDLDPMVGFLHDIRPGRPSLACDLMEPFRISLVDRLVLGLITTKRIAPTAFQNTDEGLRLRPDEFRTFLTAFEEEFQATKSGGPLKHIQATIDQWIQEIRSHADDRSSGS